LLKTLTIDTPTKNTIIAIRKGVILPINSGYIIFNVPVKAMLEIRRRIRAIIIKPAKRINDAITRTMAITKT